MNMTTENGALTPDAVDGQLKEQKTFTQDELEKIISERLARERKNNFHLSELKGLLDKLKDMGEIKEDSYALMADELILRQKNIKYDDGENTTGEVLLEQTHEDSKDDALLCETKDEISKEQNADTKDGESIFKDSSIQTLFELCEEYPMQNVAKDILSPAFKIFAEGRNGNAKDIYASYLKFLSAAEEKPSFVSRPDPRTLSSYSDTAAQTTLPSLTRHQMDMARESGMSYREYAELLNSVPKNKSSRFN